MGAEPGKSVPSGTVWTFYVTTKFSNNTDYNAFSNPWKDSPPGQAGGWNVSHSLCNSNATTRTRTYKVTISNVSASTAPSCQPYIYTGNNSGVKPSTQITVTSGDTGVSNQVVYNDGNFAWYCTTGGQSPATTESGCCNYRLAGTRDNSRICGTGVNGC